MSQSRMEQTAIPQMNPAPAPRIGSFSSVSCDDAPATFAKMMMVAVPMANQAPQTNDLFILSLQAPNVGPEAING